MIQIQPLILHKDIWRQDPFLICWIPIVFLLYVSLLKTILQAEKPLIWSWLQKLYFSSLVLRTQFYAHGRIQHWEEVLLIFEAWIMTFWIWIAVNSSKLRYSLILLFYDSEVFKAGLRSLFTFPSCVQKVKVSEVAMQLWHMSQEEDSYLFGKEEGYLLPARTSSLHSK